MDAGVSFDCRMVGINKDDLKEFVSGVLADPVRVQDSHLRKLLANSFFSDRTDGSLELELVDTLILGLSGNLSLWYWSLTATSTDADSVDTVSLLLLEA